jgi:hypothetical protein
MSGDQHHAFAKGQFVVWKAGLRRAHRYRRDVWLPRRRRSQRINRKALEPWPGGKRRFTFLPTSTSRSQATDHGRDA